MNDASEPAAGEGSDALEAESRRVLGAAPDAVERLAHSQVDSVTSGVYRVQAGGGSAVVKVVAPRSSDLADASRRPSSFRYWRREAELLRSPVLEPYRGAGIRPPALLMTIERAPEVLALWQAGAGDCCAARASASRSATVGRWSGTASAGSPSAPPRWPS